MLEFDNRALRLLPIDPLVSNRSRQVYGACFSRVRPTPAPRPRLLALSDEVARLLDLTPELVASDELARVFAGNELWPGMDPVSACYGGHQFGHWAGQLGDGRAITLGEVKNRRGEHWEIQLKGAGNTPYSRNADGRAVLRSSLREFLCSEAMHHLGVPTTRALCLVATGESVIRDILYDGRPRPEPGAVVCRVAPSFLRFGNFEIFASRGEIDVLRSLADYTVRTFFPELGAPGRDAYLAWFGEVARRTGELVARWMSVGFVHGVMNTDNLSILGLTIDYGPYGFLDAFDPAFTPNITDASGRRYRYENQPRIALWNLTRLAEALGRLVGDAEAFEPGLQAFAAAFNAARLRGLAAKLGLSELSDEELTASGAPRAPDSALLDDLWALLAAVETDYTLFFRGLARVAPTASDEALLAPIRDAFYDAEGLDPAHRARVAAWLRRYLARAALDPLDAEARRRKMDAENPKYVFRNYLAQLAIDRAEAGDPSGIAELLEVLRRPFDEQPGNERFAEKRPDWARDRAGCSMLSCSS